MPIQVAPMSKQSSSPTTPKPSSGNSPFHTIQDGVTTMMTKRKRNLNQFNRLNLVTPMMTLELIPNQRKQPLASLASFQQ